MIFLHNPVSAQDTDIGNKAQTEMVSQEALPANPVRIENVEHYKLSDAEFKNYVATANDGFGYDRLLLYAFLSLFAVAAFKVFKDVYSRLTATGKMVFKGFAFLLTVAAYFIFPPASVGMLAFTLPAGKTFDQVIKGFKEERASKANEMQRILDKALAEERSLSEDEKKKYDKLKAERDFLKDQLELAEEAYAEERKKPAMPISPTGEGNQLSEGDNKDLSKYSFLRSIQAHIPGSGVKFDGLELEMSQEAQKEARSSGIKIEGFGIPHLLLTQRTLGMFKERRDLSATGGSGGNEGGDLIQTTKMGFIDIFRNKLVLVGLGARFLTGLQGNISMPRKTSGVTGGHKTENDDSDEGTIVFDDVPMTPHRLPHYVEYSKQLMLQSSVDVNNMVRDDVVKGLATLMEYFAINGSGSNQQPTGILNTNGIGSVVGGVSGAAPDRDDIVDLETEVAIDNADIGSLAYLTNTKVRGKLKKTKTDSGSGIFVWADNSQELNGYRVGVTNNVPSTLDKGASTGVCSAIIFGNFNELVIGQWGGLDIVVDPYSQSKKGLISLTAALYYDVACQHSEGFAAMKDALTT